MALGLPRDLMLSLMSSREWNAWIAYDRVRPIDGATLAEIRHAELLTAIVNGFGSFSKRRRRMRVKQFLPAWLKRQLATAQMDPESLERMARTMTAAMGGKIIDHGDDREP